MKTDYVGIDYGLGKTNIDSETGIRYGIINQNEILQAWVDEAEPYDGEPTCPICGSEVKDIVDFENENPDINLDSWEREEYGCDDYVCPECKRVFDSQEVFPEEPLSLFIDNDEYQAECSDDYGDIFIIKSPYYTTCQFCSPCAPGAGYIMNTVEDGVKAYCFGHEFFEDEKAPYPVFSVETGKLVEPTN